VWSRLTPLPRAGRILGRAIVLLAIVMPAIASYRLLASPESYRLAEDDRWQYYVGWTSGYGADRIAEELGALAEQASGRTMVLQTPDVWSLTTYQGELASRAYLVTLDAWATPSMQSELNAYLDEHERVFLVHDEALSEAEDATAIALLESWFGVSEVMRTSRLDGGTGLVVWEISAR